MNFTHEQEKEILDILYALKKEWECYICGTTINEIIGWKPRVMIHINKECIADQFLVDVMCGPCMVIEETK